MTTVYAEAVLPLSRAMVCLNTDETIYDVSFGRCPRCGGLGIPVERWLKSITREEVVRPDLPTPLIDDRKQLHGQARPARGAASVITETR